MDFIFIQFAQGSFEGHRFQSVFHHDQSPWQRAHSQQLASTMILAGSGGRDDDLEIGGSELVFVFFACNSSERVTRVQSKF